MSESSALEEPAGLVLLADFERDQDLVEQLRPLFLEAGLCLQVLNAAEFESDRATTAAVEEAFTTLLSDLPGRRRVGVLGVGEAGERALIVGCTSRQVGFVVSVFGPLVRPELDEARSTQPLELTLNLDAPFLLFRGKQDAGLPQEHLDLLRTKLDAFFRAYEVLEFEGPGIDALRPSSAGYNADIAADLIRELVAQTLAFAADSLD